MNRAEFETPPPGVGLKNCHIDGSRRISSTLCRRPASWWKHLCEHSGAVRLEFARIGSAGDTADNLAPCLLKLMAIRPYLMINGRYTYFRFGSELYVMVTVRTCGLPGMPGAVTVTCPMYVPNANPA